MTATAVRPIQIPRPNVEKRPADLEDPTYQAFWLLRIGFTVAPILFGIDKFAHVLVDWDKYLAPEFTDLFRATLRPYDEALAARIREDARAGLLRADVDAEAVVSLFVGAYLGELIRHGQVDERWIDRCLDLMWVALARPSG